MGQKAANNNKKTRDAERQKEFWSHWAIGEKKKKAFASGGHRLGSGSDVKSD